MYKIQSWFLLITLSIITLSISSLSHANSGQDLFQQKCMPCHTIGQGIRVGPDLSKVLERKEKTWIMSFVKSSQSIVKSGDVYANDLFKKFNMMIMPDFPLTDAEISSIIEYIGSSSNTSSKTTAIDNTISELDAKMKLSSKEDIEAGQKLFTGDTQFLNGQTPCITCHNVNYKDVMGGGNFAKDLTSAYTRLKGAGLHSILSSPPFPAMKQAFNGQSLEEDETIKLLAFLYDADKQSVYNYKSEIRIFLLLGGLAGAFSLIALANLFWFHRKRGSVNDTIYDRQVRSR